MADGLLAAGAYSGTAALYDTRTMGATCVLSGHAGGITQARWHFDMILPAMQDTPDPGTPVC